MNGKLTTHVLDTALGKPAAGLAISIFKIDDDGRELIRNVSTNSDGRVDQPLLEESDFHDGIYELVFHAGEYLRSVRPDIEEPAFLECIPVRFTVRDCDQHYHIPLLLSPFGYSTYRGS